MEQNIMDLNDGELIENDTSDEKGSAFNPFSHHSTKMELILQQHFLSEVGRQLWQRGAHDFELLTSAVDDNGYDLVLVAHGVTRYIQLKASSKDTKNNTVHLNNKLSEKPGACVVWMRYDPATLGVTEMRWLGRAPNEGLGDLGDRVPRRTRANAQGVKARRETHRTIRWTDFEAVKLEQLVERLFGTA